jgi:hypothetical protein
MENMLLSKPRPRSLSQTNVNPLTIRCNSMFRLVRFGFLGCTVVCNSLLSSVFSLMLLWRRGSTLDFLPRNIPVDFVSRKLNGQVCTPRREMFPTYFTGLKNPVGGDVFFDKMRDATVSKNYREGSPLTTSPIFQALVGGDG